MKACKFSLLIGFIIIIAACGGGGGGSSAPAQQTATAATPAATPAVTYSYDKIADELSNKTWDSVSLGRFSELDSAYYTDYSTDLLLDLTEKSSSVDIEVTGTKIYDEKPVDYNWSLTEENATSVNLVSCEDSSNVTGQRITQSFANVDITTWVTADDFLAGRNIQYTNIGWIDIDWKDGSKNHDIPFAYGDATATGDLPTGGKYYDLDDLTVIMEIYLSETESTKLLASGGGQVRINFDTKKVDGTINLTKYYNYNSWMSGGGCTGAAELFGFETLTIAIDGRLVGSDMEANLILTDGEVSVGTGYLAGMLFGPDGDELGVTFFVNENQEEDANSPLTYWDFFGAGYGD